ncbi:hypothetical protein [Chitinimonas sp.]|uniref:hypothetical protein n=1 Tax=Chitinimonas sp. TaxID=1934313 RepID=UPI0035B03940
MLTPLSAPAIMTPTSLSFLQQLGQSATRGSTSGSASQQLQHIQKHVISQPDRRFSTDPDQPEQPVSISAQAKALQQSEQGKDQDTVGAAGFGLAQQLLSSFTGKALSLLGIVGKADADKVQISFDRLSYEASSAESASFSSARSKGRDGSEQLQTSASLRSEQRLGVAGHGTITTADGRKFEFDAQLQIDSSVELDQASSQSGKPVQLDFAGTAGQLLDHIEPPSGQSSPLALVRHARGDQPAGVVPGGLKLALKDGQGQALGQIDWSKLFSRLQAFVDQLDPSAQGAAGGVNGNGKQPASV